MDQIQTFVGAAQKVIDMMQQVGSKETQQVTSKETQQVVSKETQQVASKSQANKYFWDGVMVGITSACLLYTIIHPTCKVTHEATLEALEETLEEEEALEEKN